MIDQTPLTNTESDHDPREYDPADEMPNWLDGEEHEAPSLWAEVGLVAGVLVVIVLVLKAIGWLSGAL